MGTATITAIKDVSNVPITKGNIPKCLLLNNGVHCVSVKNSIMETSLKKPTASDNKTKIMAAVVNIDKRLQKNSSLSINSSLIFMTELYYDRIIQHNLISAFV